MLCELIIELGYTYQDKNFIWKWYFKSGMNWLWNSTLQYCLKYVNCHLRYKLLKPSWVLCLLPIKIFKDNRKLLANVTFPYKTLILIRLVQCLSHSRDQKFVMSLAQSAITCTQEWNVVQYLVNKTNMDSFQYHENRDHTSFIQRYPMVALEKVVLFCWNICLNAGKKNGNGPTWREKHQKLP